MQEKKISFSEWHQYFISNQDHFEDIDWENSDRLKYSEILLITESIQQFQKGESSEGKNLLKFAKDFQNEEYLSAIKLFIREEQKHALVLVKIMKANGIDKITDHWVDSVFRILRKFSNLENSIIFLSTAEIISAVYYKALREATRSESLKTVCSQILSDEEMHINFQAYTLNYFHNQKNIVSKQIGRTLHKILMFGTAMVVWNYHKQVLKKGGYSFKQFINAIFEEFDRFDEMILDKKKIVIRKVEFAV